MWLTGSSPELYAPDRPRLRYGSATTTAPSPPPVSARPVPFHSKASSMLPPLHEAAVRSAGVVTPGADDRPNLQYALDAITRDRSRPSSGTTTVGRDEGEEEPAPALRFVAAAEPLEPEPAHLQHAAFPKVESTAPASEDGFRPRPDTKQAIRPPEWKPLGPTQPGLPPSTVTSRLLRPSALITLMILCLLLLIALLIGVIYSQTHRR